jgi:DNA polymerase III subunit epsilon
MIGRERAIDTLLLARRKYPGAQNRLDDLCVRFSIDNSRRSKHGALLDAELLAEVYLELIEARQAQLGLATVSVAQTGAVVARGTVRVRPEPLRPRQTDADRAAHREFVASLGEAAIWREYLAAPTKPATPAQT